ncbi:MAG: hypothetical protein J6J79_09605 [Lachnospiraceae bacterium]|nr:hypothetical protein [Lachnospiraceae bacterium]
MKKILYQSKAIQIVIVIIALCILASLWPIRIWQERVTSSVECQTGTLTEMINEEKMVLQTIVAQYDHMDTIDLYLGEDCVGESFYLRILDEQWQQVCEEETKIDPVNLPGYQQVNIDIDMEVGKMYYIILQGKASAIYAGCEFVPLTDMPHLGVLYYADVPVEGMSLVADYHYSMPLRKGKVLAIGALTVLIAALLIWAVKVIYKKKEDKLVTAESVFKKVMNPLLAVFTVVSIGSVLFGVWGKYVLDNSVFFISTVLLSGILFYAVNHNRDGQAPIITWEYVRTHAADLLQSVAIAGAIASCCEYLNGLYDIHHYVAERKEMLWFSLAVIAMFKWKEIVNIYNGIYLVVAGICGYRYYQANLTPEMDELAVLVLKYSVWVAILLGLIIIRTVIGLCKKKLARPAYVYTGILALFFALLIIFRNGRYWGIILVVAFTLFYLNYGMWEHKARFLSNVARGVVFHFLFSTGYCLLHRQYTSYRNTRYTHIFHTVTITATYLTMVECVAMVLLLCKLVKSRKLKDIWKELLFFGVVSSYMIFTMARTAFLAIGVSVLFALVFMTMGKGKEKIIYLCKNIGLMAASALVCIPVVFTLQRNIPALVSEPHLHEIEYTMYCPEDIMRGRNVDSVNYIRVGRFIDVFAEKVFGLPEGTFDIYGEIRAYELESEENDTAKGLLPGVEDASVLVASADYVPEGAEEEDYTSGRLDIFKAYIEQANLTGHDKMGATLENGEIAVHAHNIYLQLIYDHGLITGAAFILLGIVTFVKACLYYRKKKETITYAALPAVILVAVASAGMVEWIYHVSNPCGFLLMLVITPFVFVNEGLKDE